MTLGKVGASFVTAPVSRPRHYETTATVAEPHDIDCSSGARCSSNRATIEVAFWGKSLCPSARRGSLTPNSWEYRSCISRPERNVCPQFRQGMVCRAIHLFIFFTTSVLGFGVQSSSQVRSVPEKNRWTPLSLSTVVCVLSVISFGWRHLYICIKRNKLKILFRGKKEINLAPKAKASLTTEERVAET